MKDTKNILILGGYGRTGIQIAKLLLRESRHNVHLAGRDLLKASRAARELNWEHPGERVTGVQVNAALKKQLTGVLVDHDLVIDSIPDTAFGGQIAQAALDAGIDYIDLNANKEKRLRLKGLDVEIQAAGLTFITEAGFVPGAPSLMARYVADFFDSLDVMTMGGLFRQENANNGRGIGLVPVPGDIPMIFRDGSWQKANLMASRKIDFGKGQGTWPCYPMDMPELYSLPETLGCREFGFYGSGVNRLADMTIQAWKTLRSCKLPWSTRLGAGFSIQGNERFTTTPDICPVNLTATGLMNGRREQLKFTLEHKDPYRATAIATVSCVLGLLDGSIKQPGVQMMGHVLDPEQYMDDLWRMGMTVSLQGLPDTWDEECRPDEAQPDKTRPEEALKNDIGLIGQVA